MTQKILADNLRRALFIAASAWRQVERETHSYESDSAFVSGLEAVAKALEAGERVEIVYDNIPERPRRCGVLYVDRDDLPGNVDAESVARQLRR